LWAYHDLHAEGAGDRKSTFGRIAARYGELRSLDDVTRKAQLLNYETFRAIYEGFNSRMWNDCSGVVVWMSQPSWPSLVWNFYSWDYTPTASLFGAEKGAEPVHIQMSVPECKVAIINHLASELANASVKATIYDLSGNVEQTRKQTLNAGADACTDVFTLDWPASGAHFVKLELLDEHGKLLSQNFYWHAKNEGDLQQLNSMPQAKLEEMVRGKHGGVQVKVTNSGKVPAVAIRLTLRDTKGQRILPVYYDDNYISLLPGESREIQIQSPGATRDSRVTLDGWNVEPTKLDDAAK
jgi:hypothetical protein